MTRIQNLRKLNYEYLTKFITTISRKGYLLIDLGWYVDLSENKVFF
jgi:hypothetical protein